MSQGIAGRFRRKAKQSASSNPTKAPAAPRRTPRSKPPKRQTPDVNVAANAVKSSPHAPPRWSHQEETVAKASQSDRFLDLSDPGCVSADTEYLTPTGWKRIDQYTPGDKVAQWHPASKEIEFVEPLDYIKRPCASMVVIAPTRGTSQRLSHEHRVLYYRPDGSYGVCSATQFMEDLHRKNPAHLKRKFATAFTVRDRPGLPLTDAELRLMVAVIADGHFAHGSTQCTVRLKKQRKKVRMKRLLEAVGIGWVSRQCGGQDPEFQVFRFTPPRADKEFDAFYWGATQHQLEVIADELPHWDSAIDPRLSAGVRFSTTAKRSADFAQYAFSATGVSASCSVNPRCDSASKPIEYTVQVSNNGGLVGPGRKTSVYEIDNREGYKYCFEVPTSFLLLRHNGYIFATGNTGKTRSHLEIFGARRAAGSRAGLVLAPKTLLESAWADDAAQFIPGAICSVAYAENREEAFAADADLYITNTDAVNWLAKQGKKFFNRFDSLIIDEITTYKHRTSQRSKALNAIKKHFAYRTGMTGTLTSNTVTDAWHPTFIIDDGKRLGPYFAKFRSAVCEPVQVGPDPKHLDWVDKEGSELAVTQLLSDISIRHDFEECMDIPPNHAYSKFFTLPPKVKKAYDKLEMEAVLHFDGGTIQGVHAAALRTKLLQLCSGAVYTQGDGEGEQDQYQLIDASRYKFIADLVEETEHSVTFFNWTHQKHELCKELDRRRIKYAVIDSTTPDRERNALRKAYQDGAFRTILLHPRTGAHGLTLTRGTRTIWASPVYEADLFKQGTHRVYRGGQTKRTENIRVCARGTVEDLVYQRLDEKTTRMVSFNDLMRDLKNGK